MIAAAAPTAAQARHDQRIVALADGHPLHLRELARQAAAGPAGQRPEDVPATLNASLLARLDRLGSGEGPRPALRGDRRPVRRRAGGAGLRRGRPRLGADLGRSWTRWWPRACCAVPGRRLGARYAFAQGLLEDVAYASLPRAVRTELHQRIAARLSASDRARRAPSWPSTWRRPARCRRPRSAGYRPPRPRCARPGSPRPSSTPDARWPMSPSSRPVPDSGRLLVMAKLLLATVDQDDRDLRRRAGGDGAQRVRAGRAVSGELELKVRFYPLLISTLQAIGRYDEAVVRGTRGGRAGAGGRQPGRRAPGPAVPCRDVDLDGPAERGRRGLPADRRARSRTAPSCRCCSGPRRCSATVPAWRWSDLAELHPRAARGEPGAVRAGPGAAREARTLPESICLVDGDPGDRPSSSAGDAVGARRRPPSATIELAVQLGNDWWFVWAQALLGWSVAAAGQPATRDWLSCRRRSSRPGTYVSCCRTSHLWRRSPSCGRVRPTTRWPGSGTPRPWRRSTGERFFLPYIHLVTVDALFATGASEDEIALHRRHRRRPRRRPGPAALRGSGRRCPLSWAADCPRGRPARPAVAPAGIVVRHRLAARRDPRGDRAGLLDRVAGRPGRRRRDPAGALGGRPGDLHRPAAAADR